VQKTAEQLARDNIDMFPHAQESWRNISDEQPGDASRTYNQSRGISDEKPEFAAR
jgi:hypothetical protein